MTFRSGIPASLSRNANSSHDDIGRYVYLFVNHIVYFNFHTAIQFCIQSLCTLIIHGGNRIGQCVEREIASQHFLEPLIFLQPFDNRISTVVSQCLITFQTNIGSILTRVV